MKVANQPVEGEARENFSIANGGIVMPKLDCPDFDQTARDTIAAAFPDREVVQISHGAVAEGGGIHCSTQQPPLGRRAGEME